MLADSAGNAASKSAGTPVQTVTADFPHTASRLPLKSRQLRESRRFLKCRGCIVATEPKTDRADRVPAVGGTCARVDVAGIQAAQLARELLERFVEPDKGRQARTARDSGERHQPVRDGGPGVRVGDEPRTDGPYEEGSKTEKVYGMNHALGPEVVGHCQQDR